MLAACLVGGCTLEGTTAAKALSFLPLSLAPSERGAIAHTRAQVMSPQACAGYEPTGLRLSLEGLVTCCLSAPSPTRARRSAPAFFFFVTLKPRVE